MMVTADGSTPAESHDGLRNRADSDYGSRPLSAGDGRVRVLIADDEALVRAGFRALVESAPDLTVIAEAGTGAQAVRLARHLRPDVVLMDIRMPIMDGLEAMRIIAADPGTAATRVLVVTTFDQDEHVFAALRGGASGFVLKDTRPEDLLAAIRIVAAGDALLTPSVTRRLIVEFAQRPQRPAARGEELTRLTEREREVLIQVAAGLSNSEIARRLFVGVTTVKTHVSRLLTKLGARDRAQLVVAAYESGVVFPGAGPLAPGSDRS
ncbi:two component transcriptional regulator, LuxR family [Frankia torreyi]|uniref:Two component transcriptional regulator, LuxR family n=1 Tax=Frankia torreyi TaxID=1856 RepID=A0A0D8BEB5_9ACTN|nr:MULTISPECIES: response regulator transcription factor [Frankia]KJE22299.1 two component transcriptional regulator, LuxR family [Frankia torreyi]KQM05095.1 two component transcriptional regulator, LuxR family [Frankia sp. CpI1-P]